jgi:hypothetical protein
MKEMKMDLEMELELGIKKGINFIFTNTIFT